MLIYIYSICTKENIFVHFHHHKTRGDQSELAIQTFTVLYLMCQFFFAARFLFCYLRSIQSNHHYVN